MATRPRGDVVSLYPPSPLDVMRRIWKSGRRQEGDPPHLESVTTAQRAILTAVLVRGDNDDHWRCYASAPTLGRDTGMSERNVRRILAELEARGLIRRTIRPGRSDVLHLTAALTEGIPRTISPDTMSGVTPRPGLGPDTESDAPDHVSDELPATAGKSVVGDDLSTHARVHASDRTQEGAAAIPATEQRTPAEPVSYPCAGRCDSPGRFDRPDALCFACRRKIREREPGPLDWPVFDDDDDTPMQPVTPMQRAPAATNGNGQAATASIWAIPQ